MYTFVSVYIYYVKNRTSLFYWLYFGVDLDEISHSM